MFLHILAIIGTYLVHGFQLNSPNLTFCNSQCRPRRKRSVPLRYALFWFDWSQISEIEGFSFTLCVVQVQHERTLPKLVSPKPVVIVYNVEEEKLSMTETIRPTLHNFDLQNPQQLLPKSR